MRWWSTPPHAGRDQTRAWLHGMVTAPPERSDDFVVELEGKVVGKAGCLRLPDIGYLLHPEVWGRGYATEALAAFIPHVFAAHPVDRLTADVDPRNAASLRLLDKFGFVETGRAERSWLVGDEWCDSVYLALDRPGDPC